MRSFARTAGAMRWKYETTYTSASTPHMRRRTEAKVRMNALRDCVRLLEQMRHDFGDENQPHGPMQQKIEPVDRPCELAAGQEHELLPHVGRVERREAECQDRRDHDEPRKFDEPGDHGWAVRKSSSRVRAFRSSSRHCRRRSWRGGGSSDRH